MDAKEIEQYLYQHIPITKALGVKAVVFSNEEIRFTAPISRNINHRSTVFGGSISSLLITTCWSYLRLLFDEYQKIPTIVISKSSTAFLKPINSDFTSEMQMPESHTVNQLMEMIDRFGKGRITLKADIKEKGEILAEFEGEFVVITNSSKN